MSVQTGTILMTQDGLYIYCGSHSSFAPGGSTNYYGVVPELSNATLFDQRTATNLVAKGVPIGDGSNLRQITGLIPVPAYSTRVVKLGVPNEN